MQPTDPAVVNDEWIGKQMFFHFQVSYGTEMRIFLSVIFAIIIGCESNALKSGETVSSNTRTSSCNGFKSLAKKAGYVYQQDFTDYCDSEKLRWKYDPATKVLSLLHTRNLKNCAANLKMTVELRDGVYQISESDISKKLMDCMCFFDTYCEVENCNETVITINLESKNYQIDLSQNAGFVVIDTVQREPCLGN